MTHHGFLGADEGHQFRRGLAYIVRSSYPSVLKTMAVPKLDLKRAGLVDDSLQLTRYERTHKWLQSCTDPSDSLAETETVFSAHSEVAAAPDSAPTESRAAGHARSGHSHAPTLDFRNTPLEQTVGQVIGQYHFQ